MMRGRKPTPTELKQLAGNPGKRPLNEDEPTPPVGAPDMPPHLAADPRATEAWEWLCEILDEMRLLVKSDVAIMTIYCDTWSQYVSVREQLAPLGAKQFILKSERTGSFYRNPLLDAESGLRKQLMACLTELGFSPTSRTRIHAGAGKKPESEKDPFFGVVG